MSCSEPSLTGKGRQLYCFGQRATFVGAEANRGGSHLLCKERGNTYSCFFAGLLCAQVDILRAVSEASTEQSQHVSKLISV